MTTLTLDQPDTVKWVKRALMLAWATILYNVVEGVVSMALGVAEGSVALFGFGGDSFIEVGSALLVVWRFRGEVGRAAELSLARERKATLGIGALFLLLATGTAVGAVLQLATGGHPSTTVPGVVIATLSLSFMFFLWAAKRRAAQALDSKAVAADAACSLACIKLSGVLLVGSLIFLVLPALWWVDAAAALVLAVFIGREGWEMVEAARKPDFEGGCGCGGGQSTAACDP